MQDNFRQAITSAFAIPTEVVPVHGFTEDDARLYGILLGDGHLSKDGMQWGVSGNPQADNDHLEFVRSYLAGHGIHSWKPVAAPLMCKSIGRRAWACCAMAPAAASRAQAHPHCPLNTLTSTTHSTPSALPRACHLPPAQALALVQGLLETDGCVSRGKELSLPPPPSHWPTACATRCCAWAYPCPVKNVPAATITPVCARMARQQCLTAPAPASICAFRPCPNWPSAWAARR